MAGTLGRIQVPWQISFTRTLSRVAEDLLSIQVSREPPNSPSPDFAIGIIFNFILHATSLFNFHFQVSKTRPQNAREDD